MRPDGVGKNIVMENQTASLKNRLPLRLVCAGILNLLVFSLSGCALTVTNTGWLQEDGGLTAILESGEMLPEYRYYYNGPEAKPFVILGVRQDYQFEQGLWKEIDLTEGRLRQWLEAIDNPYRDLSVRYYGSYIVDKNGDRVAIWYSFIDQATIQVAPEKKWMTVYIPTNPSHISDMSPRKKGQPSGK